MTINLSANLSADGEELFTILLGKEGRQPWRDTPIMPRQNQAAHPPLSFAQQRIWFLEQVQPGNRAYTLSAAYTLSGDLDANAFRASILEIIRRHQSLRTFFKMENGRPVQVILPSGLCDLIQIELVQLSETRRQTVLSQHMWETVQKPFDLTAPPLARFRLYRMAENEYVFQAAIHAIVADGRSMDVFMRELAVLYTAFSEEKPSPLPELAIQFADFSEWQHAWLQGKQMEMQLAYWQQQLAGLSDLSLPTDVPRPAIASMQGKLMTLKLPRQLANELRRLSEQSDVPLFVVLLSAFQVLLHRYSGQEDIAVGSPVANRSRPEIEALLGFFENTLVLRTVLSGNPPFLEVLRRVQAVTLGAYAHQEIPFERLAEALNPERDLSRNPLCQVSFAVQNTISEAGGLNWPGVTVRPMVFDTGRVRYDLECQVWDDGQELRLCLNYDRRLFNRASVLRIAESFRNLLESVVDDPARRISDLEYLSAAEKRHLLQDWNATEAPFLASICVHQMVEAHAAFTPEAIAVVAEGQGWTYADLNRRANRLARLLRRLGAGPEDCVGVLLARSPDLIVAMLAIAKAGGVYLPIDPGLPAARIAYLLEDAQVRAVIRRDHDLPEALERQTPCIHLEEDAGQIDQEEPGNLPGGPSPAHLAYILYTSDASGRPKGVQIEHGSLMNLVTWHLRRFQVLPKDRASQLASLSVGASLWEIWSTLAAGASLYLADDQARLEPERLQTWLIDNRISLAFVPPPLLGRLLTLPWPAAGALRTVLTGGDRLHLTEPPAVPFEIVNTYGPSENTVITTSALVFPGPAFTSLPPVGRPIANVRTYILDAYLQPAPVGVTGELYIGGVGLARGYHNRPDLTQERFIFYAGQRLYRTGDLARYRPDGQIEFMGRRDQQLKLGGFRVELGEIEAHLKEHPGIKDAVVAAQEQSAGKPRLVAYLIEEPGEQGTGPAQAEIEQQWQALLTGSCGQPALEAQGDFNLAGWNRSYTGAAIPAAEMHDWVEKTVEQIRSLRPRRVLEIGCGTGLLLLLQLAPECEAYWATDFSQEALDCIQAEVSRTAYASRVRLFHKMADDLGDLEPESFDTIIINSVVQYFPDIHYLLRVIEGAVRLVKPGGHIFLGDIRNAALQDVFHTSVQMEQAPDSLSLDALHQAILQQRELEDELVVAPAFFQVLKHAIPRVDHVKVLLKRGEYQNEWTRFRYDAILYVEGRPLADPGLTWFDWREDRLSLAELGGLLSMDLPGALCIRGIPNARTVIAAWAYAYLLDHPRGALVRDMRRQLLDGAGQPGVDPEALWLLANAYGYSAELFWLNGSGDGSYEAVFQRGPAGSRVEVALEPEGGHLLRPWSSYANNPTQSRLVRKRAPQLRAFLQARLPDYMIPSGYVFLDAFPMLAGGEVARHLLPPPDDQSDPQKVYAPPRTPLEARLVNLWARVLGQTHIGIYDNFFRLGGHALLATQVVAQIRQMLQIEFPLRVLFEKPTIIELAQAVEAYQAHGRLPDTSQAGDEEGIEET